ncbi:MAG: tRNA (N6-isopentenyl adenosine(37)-C2)-methylthiotransferase MiaB [Cohaesibacteraceae bacterium]|nr:tRNA (N6-isopentenyl adenosine(37)-C2)-methylthiotransferase MiaB [Cohaesibacteraceae bacterium]MBL4875123.1 tRNA (N6-isopentenyl adenosine(37)-C2)-methylthiotransferase MiaB [Cohaesibacteraceae bacterium]
MTARTEKKVFVKTYGCQMNVYDSDRMADALAPAGYTATTDVNEADLVILNTCHIREKAAEKVYSELGRMRLLKEEREARGEGRMVIGVAGCVAQAEGEEIVKRAPVVDLVFGPQSYHRLPGLLERVSNGSKVVETDFPEEDKFDHLPAATEKVTRSRGATAFLTVQEGCDKFCSFCVVPYTRGAEVSRSVAQVLDEAASLAKAGVREITLLGQNVNAYHGIGPDGVDWSLAQLLGKLSQIEGLDRLRYVTSHPRDMEDDLINAHGDISQLMPYLHLPVQSGSDKILAAMNRKHTRDDYLKIIERIRKLNPDIAMSGDFIVGFPGETDQDFEDTMSLVREVKYAQAYSFKYSTRPGTPAALEKTQVDEKIKSQRLQKLQELLNIQQKEFNQSRLGTTMDVLFERRGKLEGQLAGRSPWLQAVQVDAPENMLGEIVRVEIYKIGGNSLFGRLI